MARTRIITARVDAATAERILGAASASKTSVSTYVANLITAAIKRRISNDIRA